MVSPHARTVCMSEELNPAMHKRDSSRNMRFCIKVLNASRMPAVKHGLSGCTIMLTTDFIFLMYKRNRTRIHARQLHTLSLPSMATIQSSYRLKSFFFQIQLPITFFQLPINCFFVFFLDLAAYNFPFFQIQLLITRFFLLFFLQIQLSITFFFF